MIAFRNNEELRTSDAGAFTFRTSNSSAEPSANRTGGAEVFPDELGVDNGDGQLRVDILIIEVSPLGHLLAQHIEEARRSAASPAAICRVVGATSASCIDMAAPSGSIR